MACPSFAQEPSRRTAIEIDGIAEFDVIYRRALSNATGAVLGGFRVVDTTSLMLAAFVEFEAAHSIRPISGKNTPAKDPFYLTDKSQVSYDQLLADTAGSTRRGQRSWARRSTS